MELIKFIAIFFIAFYGLKYLFRLLMPFAIRKMTERLMDKAQQSAGGQRRYQYTNNANPFDEFKQNSSQSHRKDGEVRVEYVPQEDARQRKGPQTAGEFVDFEEIK
ncbi:MAG TPA: DUF4834 family protein [Sphingobacterium sp.]|nr:DUF4834 family protein [Sphingobacterium sp.]